MPRERPVSCLRVLGARLEEWQYRTGVIKEKSLKALLSSWRAQGWYHRARWPEPPGPACTWLRVRAADTPPPLSTVKTRDTQVERNAE